MVQVSASLGGHTVGGLYPSDWCFHRQKECTYVYHMSATHGSERVWVLTVQHLVAVRTVLVSSTPQLKHRVESLHARKLMVLELRGH